MASLENLSAAHTLLLISALLECFVALGWLLAAVVLPRFRLVSLHWSAVALSMGAAFFGYLGSSHWPGLPVVALGNLLMVGALLLQARGLQLQARQAPTDRGFIALLALTVLVQGVWQEPEQSIWRIAATSMLLGSICAWNGITVLRCLRHDNSPTPRLLGAILSAPFALASMVFALRSIVVLLAPEHLVRNGRLHESVSMLGALAWLFISLGMALAQAGVVLYQLQRELSQAATHDALTGLPNRRAADEFMAQAALRAQRLGTPMTVLMIDIDFFKKVNDRHGHAGGDHVLQTLARLLKLRARATDLVARWGGEEFLVLLPDTPTAGAQEMAEQLRLAVEQASFVWLQASVPITVSIGVATWSGGTFQASALVASADGALYQAKNSGRNRVCVADNALHLAVPDTHTAEAIRA